MKKKKYFSALVLFLGFILMLSAGQIQAQKTKIRIIEADTPLYLKADKESIEIMTLPLGTEFEVLDRVGEWIWIETPPDRNGLTVKGFVHQNAVEEVGQDKMETPPPQEPKMMKIAAPPQAVRRETRQNAMKIGIGLMFGYAAPSNSDYSGGLKYGLGFIFIPIKYLAVEVYGHGFQSETERNVDLLSEGKLSFMEMGLNLQGRFPIGSRFVPYVSTGFCYSMNGFKLDSGFVSTWNNLGFDISETVDNSIGYNAGIGFEFNIVRGLALGLDFKYQVMSPDGEWSIKDQYSSVEQTGEFRNLEMNSIFIVFGIKYFFNF